MSLQDYIKEPRKDWTNDDWLQHAWIQRHNPWISEEDRQYWKDKIGDNLKTDILGANKQNFDSLLITNGIHREEIKNEKVENIVSKYNTSVDYTQSKLKW